MGQGLSTSDAGVQVMLIGEDGRAFMQRIDRYPDVGGMSDLALYSHPRFVRHTTSSTPLSYHIISIITVLTT